MNNKQPHSKEFSTDIFEKSLIHVQMYACVNNVIEMLKVITFADLNQMI